MEPAGSVMSSEDSEAPIISQQLSTLQSIAEDAPDLVTSPLAKRFPRSSSLSATLDRDKIPPTLATKTTTDAVWRRPECSNCPTTVLPPLEDPVQGTTDDASISKLSAATSGYYEDPYLHYFVRHPCRRSPLINRGYFTRVAAIRKMVAEFLNAQAKTSTTVQIVNLGAGLDTLYFWLTDLWSPSLLRLYECDYPEVISKKLSIFTRRSALWDRLGHDQTRRSMENIIHDAHCETRQLMVVYYLSLCLSAAQQLHPTGGIKIADSLTCISVDIRQCSVLNALLRSSGFSSDVPTLFISECVLIYLHASQSDTIIQWAAEAVTAPSAFVVYEQYFCCRCDVIGCGSAKPTCTSETPNQILPHDPFGRTMVKNLELRGCPLLGIQDYPTLESQKRRFLNLGWTHVSGADMNDVYDRYLDKFEVVRVQNLELFDEIEEWRLIQAHYFILVAVKSSTENVALAKESTELPTAENICQTKSELPSSSLGHLEHLAHMWENSQQVTQALPRFTTEEFRLHPETIQSLCSGNIVEGSCSSLKPGTLSYLLRPAAMHQVFPHGQ